MDPLSHIVHHLSWWWNQNYTLSELKTVINITGCSLDKHAFRAQNITAVKVFSALVWHHPGILREWQVGTDRFTVKSSPNLMLHSKNKWERNSSDTIRKNSLIFILYNGHNCKKTFFYFSHSRSKNCIMWNHFVVVKLCFTKVPI